MVCKPYKQLLSAYSDGELPSDRAKSVASHLQSCQECQREMASVVKLKSLCRQLTANTPTAQQWGDFTDQFWAKVAAQQRQPVVARFYQKFRRIAGVLLIAGASLGAFLFLYPGNGHEEPIFQLNRALADKKIPEPITHNPVAVAATIKPYKVTASIKGLSRANLSQTETDFLFQHGFVVTERQFPSFVTLYRRNQQEDLPSFITADSAISGLSHILARVRVDLERELFYNKLMSLTTILAEKLLVLHEDIPATCKEASLRALAFLRVADELLDAKRVGWPLEIEAQISTMVEEELKLIYNGRQKRTVGIQRSPIFGYDIDYNQFKVRWDAAREDKLKRYYQTLEWYNRCAFRSSSPSETQSALLILMAAIGDNAEGIIIWEEMRQLLTALYGEPDDPHLLDYLAVARKVYGDTISPSILSNQELLSRFCRQVSRVRPPQIRSEVGLNSGLRMFGGVSYDRDLMLQQLLYPYVGHEGDPRVLPSIVDIGVILGHPKALDAAKERDYFNFVKYESQIKRYQERLHQSLSVSNPWQGGGFVAQAWLYEALMQPESKGLPAFTRSDAWSSRKLTSILCGILGLAEINSKPTFSGKGDGNFTATLDPYPEFFNRMVTSIKNFEAILKSVGYPLERPQGQEIVAYKKAMQALAAVSANSLTNDQLGPEDQQLLRNFALGWEGDYEEANINELSILFHRNDQQFDDYFYAGIEPIRELWVACPGSPTPFLARGGVYLLYGFATSKKILPEHWRHEKIWDKIRNESVEGVVPWAKEYVSSYQH